MEAAFFFDFDGVIADSEPLHFRAFAEVLGPLGMSVSWEEYVRDLIGFDDRDVIRKVHERAGRAADAAEVKRLMTLKAERLAWLAEREPPPLYPGVPELLDGLRRIGGVGLCTGAVRSDIEVILRGTGLESKFDVIVTADDVPTGKPDPAGYRLAKTRLAARRGDEPGDLAGVAVEDTPAGINAARLASLRVLAVATTHSKADLAGADRVVSRLTEVRPVELRELALS